MNIADIKHWLQPLCHIPGMSGHEDPVTDYIRAALQHPGSDMQVDSPGNLLVTVPGTEPDAPRVMVFAHTDQIGLVVRKIEDDGYLRVERVGGVPERVLPGLQIVVMNTAGQPIPGVVAMKAHHATPSDEKYAVMPVERIFIDLGATSAEAVAALGIGIGSPITYKPAFTELEGNRVCGTAIDDRGGCAALMALVKSWQDQPGPATLHAVFSAQEEFNLRGAMVAAHRLHPDCAISLDIMVSSDTPDLGDRGELVLGGGPALGMYSFHGRGTLNGTLPHPSLVRHINAVATQLGIPLQRSAHSGCLTDSSYVQLTHDGIPSVDLGYPARYTHTPVEVCDLDDLLQLAKLLDGILRNMPAGFSFARRAVQAS